MFGDRSSCASKHKVVDSVDPIAVGSVSPTAVGSVRPTALVSVRPAVGSVRPAVGSVQARGDGDSRRPPLLLPTLNNLSSPATAVSVDISQERGTLSAPPPRCGRKLSATRLPADETARNPLRSPVSASWPRFLTAASGRKRPPLPLLAPTLLSLFSSGLRLRGSVLALRSCNDASVSPPSAARTDDVIATDFLRLFSPIVNVGASLISVSVVRSLSEALFSRRLLKAAAVPTDERE
jgi:hypothetical protein